MELAEVLRRRRMVRRYRADAPADSVLHAVLDAALRSPSAGFTQAVSHLLLTGAAVEDFWGMCVDPRRPQDRWLDGMRTAPALVLVWTSREAYLDRYAEPDKGVLDRDPDRWSAPYWYVDAGMAVMAMLLAAVDHGLGAGFFGVPVDRQDDVRGRFGVPAEQLSVGVVSLGYSDPATSSRPSRPRRSRPALIHSEHW